jgi:hypothetical protein
MTDFLEAYKKLLESKKFKEWKAKNKDCFLSYGFLIIDSNKGEEIWKIGFYHPSNDNLTSFIVGKEILIEPESAVFKAPDMKVSELDIDKIKIDYYTAVKIANERQKEAYKHDNPTNILVILQHIEIGQVWNITYVTERMNTLNFKIDTSTGNIKYEKLSSIMDITRRG